MNDLVSLFRITKKTYHQLLSSSPKVYWSGVARKSKATKPDNYGINQDLDGLLYRMWSNSLVRAVFPFIAYSLSLSHAW